MRVGNFLLAVIFGGAVAGCGTAPSSSYTRSITPMDNRPNADISQRRTNPELNHQQTVQAIAEGLVSALVSKDTKAPERIKGECRIRPDGGANIATPCLNVLVVLKDGKEKEVARTRTDNGRWSFEVKDNATYTAVIDLSAYKLPRKAVPNLTRGSDIRIDIGREPAAF